MFEIKILASSSAGNAYVINDNGQKILIDPGIRMKSLRRKANFNLATLDLCLISHEHQDHCKAAKNLAKLGVPVFTSAGTAASMKHKIHTLTIRDQKELNIKGWRILPFATQHDAAEPLGFLIITPSGKKVCHATDTHNLEYKFLDVTHWMIECNHSDHLIDENKKLAEDTKNRIRLNHMSLGRLKAFFGLQGMHSTEEIYLLHMSENNSDSDYFKKEIEKVTGKPVYGASDS